MKNFLVVVLLLTVSGIVSAQENYQKGYYIDQADEKIEGWINNQQWRYSPQKILFKSSENAAPRELTPDIAKVVHIEGQARYLGGSVMIDYSSDDLRKITHFKEARLERKSLFLRTLIEGKASLYEYSMEGLRRYFYSTGDQPVEQLIYKAYQEGNVVRYNKTFKTELWDQLKCGAIKIDQIQDLEYNEKDLKAFFISYNRCQNAEFQNFSAPQTKSEFNIWIRPGVQSSKVELLEVSGGATNRSYNLSANTSLRIGALIEYTLPFRRGKLSVVAEPTFQSASITETVDFGSISGERLVEVDYSSIVFPIGLRYYALNSGKSRLSLSAYFISDLLDFNSTVIIVDRTPLVEVNAQPGLSGEITYQYEDKYSLGLQYGLKRDLISNTATTNNISAKFSYLSVFFGYKIF